jgi:hypothetical protein
MGAGPATAIAEGKDSSELGGDARRGESLNGLRASSGAHLRAE